MELDLSMNSLLAVVLLLATEPVPATRPPAPQTIETDLHEQTVVATGLTPGREAVMLAVGRESRGLVGDQLVRYSGGALADAQGRARFALARPLPQRSLWVVIDPGTGRLAVGTPEGSQELSPPYTSVVRNGRSTRVTTIVTLPGPAPRPPAAELVQPIPGGWAAVSTKKLESVELVLVRPGQAAWHSSVADGSRADPDRKHDRKITVAAASLARLGAGSSTFPQMFQAGDRILAIDPLRLAYRLIEVR